MDLAGLIRLGILVSMVLLVFGLGLRCVAGEATYVLRRPALLARSLLAMSVLMPLLMIGLVLSFDLKPPVRIALVALALSPVPPFLPGKQLRVSASAGYTFGLFVAAASFAVVLVPAVMTLIGVRVAGGLHVSAAKILTIVATTVLVPLAAGILVRRIAPGMAKFLTPFATKVGGLLLVIVMIPVLVSQWPSIRSLLGDGTLLAIIAFTVVGLILGHALGGPEPEDRTVLALATASRHPAVALAIASASFPEQKLVPSAVLLALLVGTIVSAPYVAWRRRAHAAGTTSGPGNSPAHRHH